MSEHTTICPSGLKITVRGLKASELDLFANKQEAANRMISNKILAACTVTVEDYGPIYKDLNFADGDFWDDILLCDRFSTLLAVRIATHGPDYNFRVKCSSDSCGKQFEWGMSLQNLEQYELPMSSYANAFEGAPFRATLSNGHEFYFKLLRGSDERAIAAQIEKNYRARVTTGLARRVCRVSVDGKDFTDYHRVSDWVRNLTATESLELIAEMDAVDGGYNTEVQIFCPHCSNDMEVNIPFDEEFWIKKPSSSSKDKRVIRRNQV
jgi:hypothetical protein